MFSKDISIKNTTRAMIREAMDTITALLWSSAQVGQEVLLMSSSYDS